MEEKFQEYLLEYELTLLNTQNSIAMTPTDVIGLMLKVVLLLFILYVRSLSLCVLWMSSFLGMVYRCPGKKGAKLNCAKNILSALLSFGEKLFKFHFYKGILLCIVCVPHVKNML